jgi:hypothetical protein
VALSSANLRTDRIFARAVTRSIMTFGGCTHIRASEWVVLPWRRHVAASGKREGGRRQRIVRTGPQTKVLDVLRLASNPDKVRCQGVSVSGTGVLEPMFAFKEGGYVPHANAPDSGDRHWKPNAAPIRTAPQRGRVETT